MKPTCIVLIRHAKPEAMDSAIYSDEGVRPLSDEGRAVQLEMAQQLKAEGVKPDAILHSPLLRAEQTAAIVATELGGKLEPEPALGTAFDEQRLLTRIAPHQTTVMVGHDPTLAGFANQLLGENFLPSGMVKSGAVIIRFATHANYGQGELHAYLRPGGKSL